jgi:ribosomal-protein-alanine N-acetyltransferase
MQLKKHKTKKPQKDWEIIVNKRIVGTLSFLNIDNFYEILYIEVENPFRKKGYGQILIKELIISAKEKNKKEIFLEVSSNNIPAINLYKKYNFKEYSTRKKYYKDGSDAIMMKLEFQ